MLTRCSQRFIRPFGSVYSRNFSMLSNIKNIPKQHPLLFGAVFTCSKTMGADLFVQTKVEGKEWEDVDFRRTATFAVFGFGYMGIAQYFLYVHLMARRWFPQASTFVRIFLFRTNS